MLFWMPPAPPVSYSAQVAPILALHCNSCHGGAGGLSTRTWKELMDGGHLGKLVIPGDPARSVLLEFLDGRRGTEQRMPIGGAPLSREQIDTISRWVAEGANDDPDTTPRRVRTVSNVRAGARKLLRIKSIIDSQSYLIITVRDPATGRELFTDVASVKLTREANDAAAPGQPVEWNVRTVRSWPEILEFELVVKYAPASATVQLSVDVMNAP